MINKKIESLFELEEFYNELKIKYPHLTIWKPLLDHIKNKKDKFK